MSVGALARRWRWAGRGKSLWRCISSDSRVLHVFSVRPAAVPESRWWLRATWTTRRPRLPAMANHYSTYCHDMFECFIFLFFFMFLVWGRGEERGLYGFVLVVFKCESVGVYTAQRMCTVSCDITIVRLILIMTSSLVMINSQYHFHEKFYMLKISHLCTGRIFFSLIIYMNKT